MRNEPLYQAIDDGHTIVDPTPKIKYATCKKCKTAWPCPTIRSARNHCLANRSA